MLAKSEFNISKKFACVFDEIDNPTEKERAEIREINARTDATYINAGVVAPEEIREVLRNDEKSGYTALSEEMAEEPLSDDEPDPFGENGGSSTEQDPFSIDEEPEFRTTKNGVKFPLKEGESTKESCEEFFKDKQEEKESQEVKKSSNRGKIDSSKYPTLKLPKEEYGKVMHELNNNLTKEQRRKKQIVRAIGNNIYTIENNGFNEYRIIDKNELD